MASLFSGIPAEKPVHGLRRSRFRYMIVAMDELAPGLLVAVPFAFLTRALWSSYWPVR